MKKTFGVLSFKGQLVTKGAEETAVRPNRVKPFLTAAKRTAVCRKRETGFETHYGFERQADEIYGM